MIIDEDLQKICPHEEYQPIPDKYNLPTTLFVQCTCCGIFAYNGVKNETSEN